MNMALLAFWHRLLRMIACMTILSLGLGEGALDAIKNHVGHFYLCLMAVIFALAIFHDDYTKMSDDFQQE